MKLRLSLLALSLACFAYPAFAQAPAGAPAGATGQCKDGTYWTGASKSGACRGHKGIQTWFAASNAKPAPGTPPPSANVAAKPAPGATPTTKPAPTPPLKPSTSSAVPKPAATPAPGGGNGQVWVNAETKVYHCQGDRYYGTTKNGKYMSESDAQKMGAKPSRGKPCSAR